MTRWLYCWELGSGLGHLMRMRSVAQALHERGDFVEFAVPHRYVNRATQWWENIRPIPQRKRTHTIRAPGSFAEVLINEGWSGPSHIREITKQWRDIYADSGADKILLDYAPGMLLTCVEQNWKAIQIGTGFYLPPNLSCMPSFRADRTVYPDRLRINERQVLRVVNQLLEDRQNLSLPYLSALFHHANITHLLTSEPSLDHYQNRTDMRYFGVCSATGANIDQLPKTTLQPQAQSRAFAYLKPFHGLQQLLVALVQRRIETHIHGCEEVLTQVKRSASGWLHPCDQPVNELSIARRCDWMIQHAGHDGSCKAMQAGLPLMLIPLTIEQALTAENVVQLEAGICVRPEQQKQPGPVIDRLLASLDRLKAGAGRFAANSTPQSTALNAVMDLID